jgi:hypothetical protein
MKINYDDVKKELEKFEDSEWLEHHADLNQISEVLSDMDNSDKDDWIAEAMAFLRKLLINLKGMNMNKEKSIWDIVESHPTKYKEGFTSDEIDSLLKDKFPNISRDTLSEKVGVVTCMVKDDNVIFYHSDIELAMRCCLENREQYPHEWD